MKRLCVVTVAERGFFSRNAVVLWNHLEDAYRGRSAGETVNCSQSGTLASLCHRGRSMYVRLQ